MSFISYSVRYMGVNHQTKSMEMALNFMDQRLQKGQKPSKDDVQFFTSIFSDATSKLDKSLKLLSLTPRRVLVEGVFVQVFLFSLLVRTAFLIAKLWSHNVPLWDTTFMSVVLIFVCVFCFQVHHAIRSAASFHALRLFKALRVTLSVCQALYGISPSDPYCLHKRTSEDSIKGEVQ